MQNLTIGIVGAGIGGLSAALGLQRVGLRVRVFEQSPVLGEIGAGLSLSPTAVHALNSFGLHEELVRDAYAPEDQAVRHYRDARPLLRVNRGRSLLEKYGERYYVIHRADLHDILRRHVVANDAQAIELNRRCRAVTQSAGDVRIEFEGGAAATVDALVGADGSRSVIRRQLFGASDPQFTGYIAWRGLVPMERVPATILDPPSGVFVGPNRQVNRYPVHHGRLLNFVAFAERSGWAEEGWSIRSEVHELLAEFEGWHPDVLTFMAATPPGSLFKWGLFDREPLEKWSSGRVTLLGDAAHPLLPFLGHGAVLAIEDGCVLARAFQAAASVEEAFERYENARRERAAFVVHQSRLAVKKFHDADPDTYAERLNNRPADEGLGLFSYDPATVPV